MRTAAYVEQASRQRCFTFGDENDPLNHPTDASASVPSTPKQPPSQPGSAVKGPLTVNPQQDLMLRARGRSSTISQFEARGMRRAAMSTISMNTTMGYSDDACGSGDVAAATAGAIGNTPTCNGSSSSSSCGVGVGAGVGVGVGDGMCAPPTPGSENRRMRFSQGVSFKDCNNAGTVTHSEPSTSHKVCCPACTCDEWPGCSRL